MGAFHPKQTLESYLDAYEVHYEKGGWESPNRPSFFFRRSRHGSESRDVGPVALRGLGRSKAGRPASVSLRTAPAVLRTGVAALAYLLLNWKLRRALARPYFLRSTARLSRVRKPACLTTVRSAGS